MATFVVSQILGMCRDQLDESSIAAGKWNDTILQGLIYDGSVEIAMLGVLREVATFTTTTTGTYTYSFPNNVLRVNRVTCNGGKLTRISEDQLDRLTSNSGLVSAASGAPVAYVPYDDGGRNGLFDLYPPPDASYAVRGYFSKLPSVSVGSYTSQTTLEVPPEHAHLLQHYVLERSFGKEIDPECLQRAQIHGQIWREGLRRITELDQQKQTADRFFVVQDQDAADYAGYGWGYY